MLCRVQNALPTAPLRRRRQRRRTASSCETPCPRRPCSSTPCSNERPLRCMRASPPLRIAGAADEAGRWKPASAPKPARLGRPSSANGGGGGRRTGSTKGSLCWKGEASIAVWARSASLWRANERSPLGSRRRRRRLLRAEIPFSGCGDRAHLPAEQRGRESMAGGGHWTRR